VNLKKILIDILLIAKKGLFCWNWWRKLVGSINILEAIFQGYSYESSEIIKSLNYAGVLELVNRKKKKLYAALKNAKKDNYSEKQPMKG
jgi:hypothetical protein